MQTDADREVILDLEKFPSHSEESVPRQTFADVVVNKPWGYEFLSCETPLTACWNLFIKFNHQTSMHAHPGKQTVMVPLTDGVVLTTLAGEHSLRAGDVTYLEPGVFHRSTSTSLQGDFMLEFETPVDKFDLIRLDDSYGRVRNTYEGTEHESKLGNGIEIAQWLHHRDFSSESTTLTMGGQELHFLRSSDLDKSELTPWASNLNLVALLGTELEKSEALRFVSPREVSTALSDDIVAIGIKYNA